MISTGAVLTDAYNLRKSCRETPKKGTPNLGSKKPVKPESSVPSISNKKRPRSPLRRSGRIEKIGVSCSPNAKRSIEFMTPSKKKKMDVDDSKNKKLDTECKDTSKKSKLLLARNYVRSIFASDDNEISDDESAHLEDDALTKDTNANLSLSTSELHEGLDECNSSKEDKCCGENNDDSSKEFGEGSCSGSRELDIHKDLVHKSGKNKNEENSSNSDHSLSSSNSQPEKEIECAKYTDFIHDAHKLEVEGSKTKEDSIFVVRNLEKVGDSVSHENVAANGSHSSSTLMKSGSTVICTKVSQADTTSFLPKRNSSDDIRSHTTCNKLERGTFGVRDGTSNSGENQIESQNESLAVVQTDGDSNACNACKQSGNFLLCCGGKNCKEKYHLSCFRPPLPNIPSDIWLCSTCVKKKVELGVYSVSQGIESIWDVKQEAEKGNVYLVKYAGLAHVHNQWILESQLLPDAVNLIEKFNKRGKKGMATRWKQEWTEPQRILQKRLLTPKSIAGTEELLYCYSEYLVKWKCLGYDNATWELEKEPFLCTSFGKKLISDFENRIKEAKKTSDPSRVGTVLLSKKSSLHKLARIPDDWPAGVDNLHLNTVNQLLECWRNLHHAVLNVDQERIIKSILFLSSIKPYTCQPVLVVSTVHSLSLWEAEFARLAPSINVVVYTGNKDTRKLIRSLEFYEDSGCIMFQVLLSHPNAIVEDFDNLDSIAWELMIVDDCQHPRVSNHLETFKNIPTKFRLLLLSSQLKDNDAEYLNLLSFLESGGEENSSINSKYNADGTLDILVVLKKKLACYVIEHVQKSKLPNFVEYWVPVHLSNVQLEQYCSTLVSNSVILQSSIKNDHVGALRDILISTRKCCDHPYLVSQSLPSFLTAHLPLEKYLDVGVKASSKLHLLDRFLHEIKKKEMRALIIYQSIGLGRDCIGDILDDFISQKFGSDSFERVDSGLQSSKKLAALNKFNDKANRRFVFLLESHACLPSIKLSSVDLVILFDSDWNPLNDLKAIQKIQIDSQFEYINVFRLYMSRTIEEKVLIFAKQDTVLDSHIQGLSPGNSHLLLSWGANYLFSQLDEFHRYGRHEYSEECVDKCFFDESTSKFIDDVIVEMVNCLPGAAEEIMSECLFLVRAHQKGASYSRNIKLAGEKDGMSSFDNDPSTSWSNIFQNRRSHWKFITSEPSQRSRRKVQLFGSYMKAPEVENEARKKRRKLSIEASNDIKVLDDIDLSQPQLISFTIASPLGSKVIKEPDGIVNHATRKLLSSSNLEHIVECESKHNDQGDFYLHLKPKLSELSDTLKLPDEVKSLAHVLLEYIMNNHIVNRDPETILQAFMLSLCWRAASFLKHKLDHRECQALANKYLNYTCSEEEANSVYSKLRMLKKKISQLGTSEHEIVPGSAGKLFSASGEANALEMKDVPDEHRSSESKEVSTPGHVSKPNFLETRSSVFREADHSQKIIDGFNDNRSSENNDVLAFRHGNVPKTFENQTEPRDAVVDEGNIKKNTTVSESLEIPSSRHEYESLSCKNYSSALKESDATSVGNRKINVASDQNLGSLKDKLLKKRIDLVDIVSSTRKKSLLDKQQEELSDFNVQRETERIRMNKVHDAQIDLIHSIHVDHKIRNEKIRLLNLHFAKKMAEFDEHMLSEHKRLTIMQESVMHKENEIRDSWLEDAGAGTLDGSFDTLPLTETGFILEKFKGVSELGDAWVSELDDAYDLMSSHIKTKVPNALNTENNLELPSTPPSRISREMPRSTEPYSACADISGSTSNIVSSVVELEPAVPNQTCYENPGSTLNSTVSNLAEVQLVEPNKNCSEVPEPSMLPIPLIVAEEEATQQNRILADILVSSSDPILSTVAGLEPIEKNKICAEIPGMTSDLLPPVEPETIELNKYCSEIPKSTSGLITSSVEIESNEKNKLCSTNLGLTSDSLPSVEDEATELHKMVDEIPRSILDNLPSSVVENVPSKPNRKGGEIHGLRSVLTFDTLTTVSPAGPTEISKTDPTTDPSKAPSSIVEEELTQSNGTCAETPGSTSGFACNNATTISSDDPVTPLIEAREIVVSGKTSETCVEIPAVVLPAIDVGISLEEVPSRTTENEIVAERVTIGMVAVESGEPHESSTENIAPESISLTKENEIITSESIGVVEERVDPSSCPVENLDIPKETEGLPSHNASDERITYDGEKTVGCSEIRSTSLQTEDELPSTLHSVMDFCTVSSNMVSVHENYTLANVRSSQVELSVDGYPLTETAQAKSPQLLRTEREQIVDTVSNMLNASAEKSDELVVQSILPLPLSSEAEVAISSLNSHGELAAQQSTVKESLQAHQSNELTPPPILHLPPLSEAEVINSSNLQRNLPAQQLNMHESLQTHQSNELSPQPILHLSPLSEAEVIDSSNLQRNVLSQQLTVQESLQVHQANELCPQPILHLPPLSVAEVINSSNLQRNLPSQQPVVNENLLAGHSNLSHRPVLHSPASVEVDLSNGLPAQRPIANESLHIDQSHQLISHPIFHAPPSFETASIPNSQSVLAVQRPIVNESVHAEQSNVLGFQSVGHLPLLPATSLPERTQIEGNTGTSVSREPENCGFQFIPLASLIHPQALHPDPLQNELTRIHKQTEIRKKMHEDKKLQLKLECEQEVEKVRRKYDTLIKEDESGYNQDKKYLDTIYSKVLINRILAEEFRSKFIDTRPVTSPFTQGRPAGPTPQFHQMHMPQGRPTAPAPALASSPRPPSTPSVPRPSLTPPAPRPSLTPLGPRPSSIVDSYRTPQSSSVSPISMPAARHSLGPSSLRPATCTTPPGLVHTTPSVIPTIPNFRPPGEVRTPAPRAPAPHRHRYIPATSPLTAAAPTGQASSASSRMLELPPMEASTSISSRTAVFKAPIVSTLVDTMPSTNLGSDRRDPPFAISEAPAMTPAGDVVCLSDDE